MKKLTDTKIEEIIKNAEREIKIQELIGNKIAVDCVRDALKKFVKEHRPASQIGV